jgi:hypothetical protein
MTSQAALELQNAPTSFTDGWEIAASIANIALAAVAIFSLYVAIRNSTGTANSLGRFEEALKIFTQPVIAYSHLQLVYMDANNEKRVSPTGFLAFVKNVSNVPIQLEEASFAVFYGLRELPQSEREVGNVVKLVVAPGGTFSLGKVHTEIESLLLRIPPYVEPTLRFRFTAKVGVWGRKEKYQFVTAHLVHYGPPDTLVTSVIEESMVALES